MNYEAIIDGVLANEKGFVDHPDDHGGPTNFGITQAVARANGWQGDMKDLPESLARSIYLKRYVVAPSFDRIAQINDKIGFKVIDTGVVMGPGVSAMFLQRCLNVFNMQGSRYADVFVDGRIGPVTLQALATFLRWRGDAGEQVLLKAFNCVQGTKLIEIAEHDPSQEQFEFGWFSNRISI